MGAKSLGQEPLKTVPAEEGATSSLNGDIAARLHVDLMRRP